MASHRHSIIAALVILAAAVPLDWASASNHIRGVSPIVTINRESLEIKTGINPADLLLVGELHDNGTENQIDLYTFSAAPDGVTAMDSFTGLAAGNVFAMGDWCIGPDYAAMPFIDRAGGSFDIGIAGYAYSGASAMTTMIPDSAGTRYTTTDCSVLEDGTFIVSAQNFDAGTIDYFSSTDQGGSWNLEASFSLPSHPIISPFDGGFRPTSGAIGNDIGTVAQGSNGLIVAAQVNPFSGSPLGSVNVFDHSAEIGNGFLKECDGLTYGNFAFGLCNKGNAVWGGSIDLNDGGLDTALLNNVGIGATHSFQGVSVSAGVFGGEQQFHTFTDRHIVTPFDGTTWGTPFEATGYPFADEGGPVDSSTAMSLERIFVTGLVRGGSADNVYPAIATIDPTLIGAAQTAGEASIPLLTPAALAMLALLLALAGARARHEDLKA